MKQLVSFNPFFDPVNKTLDFRMYPNFQPDLLYGVINVTRSQILYAPGTTTYGGTWSGSTVTLTFNTASYASTDLLNVYYEVAPDTMFNNSPVEMGGMLEAMYILQQQMLIELKIMNYQLQQGFYPALQNDLDTLRKDMLYDGTPEGIDNTGLG
jgi:hypothetical protein